MNSASGNEIYTENRTMDDELLEHLRRHTFARRLMDNVRLRTWNDFG